ncbi:FAD-dependent oxidoreductase [Sphaerisporangium rufum]|uniref:FAD-dependent oxidoreductase n=1 Tax=Sphaerisporangium rufum TaxID=1381558 RepID=A0A919R6X2_9ACTN|nr:FAD-dependent monooxygenase [Sphaerisporangium rufum]GII80739.1 FAD-dependent oxidoreductase [Sphaerisporangium rufum]
MKNQRILISGAGIAGLTLAHWLRRHGFTPTVVEHAPAPRAGGYKIDIRGAAVEVARRTGILPEVRRARTDVREAAVVDARGRRVAAMTGDTFGGRSGEDAEILRGDLLRLVHDAVPGEVEVVFGERVTGLDDTGQEVTVTFASGATRAFDLVIGADGLHSGTRALAFGPEEHHVHDLGYRVAAGSVPNHLGLDRCELTYVAPGRTALTYSTAGAAGATAMFLFANDSGGPATAAAGDRDRRHAALAAAYAGEGWEVPRLVEGVRDAPDFYLDSLSQVRMDRWSSGRVALVGDAAYCASAASGQGTSLALVGAYVLAGELAAAGGDHVAGFAGYERRMRPFAEINQRLGPANIRRMVLRTPAQVWVTMKALSIVRRLPGADRMMAKAMAPLHRAANAIDLPAY